MRQLIVLLICFPVIYAAPQTEHSQQDDHAKQVENLMKKDLDKFNEDLKAGKSLKSYYNGLLDLLQRTQEDDKVLKDTSMQIVSQFDSLYSVILNNFPEFTEENKESIINLLETNVQDFKSKAMGSDKIYDFFVVWIQLRLKDFPKGMHYHSLVNVQYDMIEAKKALKLIIEAIEEAMDVIKRTDINESIIYNTVIMLKDVIENNKFDKKRENAIEKLNDLVNEPTYPYMTKMYGHDFLH